MLFTYSRAVIIVFLPTKPKKKKLTRFVLLFSNNIYKEKIQTGKIHCNCNVSCHENYSTTYSTSMDVSGSNSKQSIKYVQHRFRKAKIWFICWHIKFNLTLSTMNSSAFQHATLNFLLHIALFVFPFPFSCVMKSVLFSYKYNSLKFVIVLL